MEIAAPSSRSPQALRGAPLRDALRELGNGEDTPHAESAVVARAPLASAVAPVYALVPVDGDVDVDANDDEPAPRALRPHELAGYVARPE
ncbi:MAG TPA: hypothetical protein VGG39_08195 [Polyangiaceae bacterium]|jgi:hypothetical protein